jgi:RNA binding exosome subunit
MQGMHMKQELHVSLIRISAHVHPTEVVEKVKQALCYLLSTVPADLDKNLETNVLEGDYGNKIHVLTCVLKNQKEIGAFFQRLKSDLPDEHKKVLRQYFESFYNGDTKTLYLRLHKQSAFQNMLRLSQYDDIFHVSIKFSAYTSTSALTNILKYLDSEINW